MNAKLKFKIKLAMKKPKAAIKYAVNSFRVGILHHELLLSSIIGMENNCQLACEKCCFGTIFVNKKTEKFSVEKIRDIAHQSKKLGAVIIDIVGGEPTLNPDLFKILEVSGGDNV